MFRLMVRRLSGLAATADGSTLVALHPATGVPYEQSKPIPEIAVKDDGPLKRNLEEIRKSIYTTSGIHSRRELAKITMTTEHRWYPRSRDKRVKPIAPDRPYL